MGGNPRARVFALERSRNSKLQWACWITILVGWAFYLLPVPVVSLVGGSFILFVALILSIVLLVKAPELRSILTLIALLIVSPIVYFVGLAILAAVVGTATSSVMRYPHP